MSNCPGPKRGFFYILIVDLISRSTLVLFSLLGAINYHYNKGNMKMEFLKCKTIHIILLRIAVLLSILIQWVIKIPLIYIIARYTWIGTVATVFHWTTTIILFLSCFILNCHRTLLLSQISNLFFCGIYEHNFFAVVK